MGMHRTVLSQARLALPRAVGGFLFQRNIDLIDIGFKVEEGRLTNRLAIRVHVHEKRSGVALEAAVAAGDTREVPEEIGGVETDVVEGVYWGQQWPWWGGGTWGPVNPRARRADPMAGGISISSERLATYGTLGGLVRDRATGQEMLLSASHVLVGTWGARPGDRIYQPGRGDGGTSADTIAILTRDAMAENLDAAVATLTDDRELVNRQLDLGSVDGVRHANLGMRVVKSGRKTKITFGQVSGIDGVQKLSYRGVNRMIRSVISIDPQHPAGEVSAGGDSGSWWLDSETGQVVGLHFAGSNYPERALAIDMPTVLAALDIDIVL